MVGAVTESHDEPWLPPDDLGDRHKVWQFVGSYVAAFGLRLPLADGWGTDPADLDAAAVRLGRALPAVRPLVPGP
jgi:hypothetical protein